MHEKLLKMADYIRRTAAPHVKPPPMASNTTIWPGWMRPSRVAVSSASGTDAAEVLGVSQGQLLPIREDWFEIRA